MKKRPIHPLLCLVSICAFPAALKAQPLAPQPLGPIELRASAGIEHDTNVFRSPENAERSDEIGLASLGVKFDKRYGLQRVQLDAETTLYRYRNLSELDYSTLNYAAAWNWQLTPALQGVLSADRRQYRDVTNTPGLDRVSRRTTRSELFEARYEIDGAWRALAGLSRESNRSTDPRSFDASYSVRNASAGAAYEFSSGRSLTARFRRGQGEYTDASGALPGADFRENEAELLVKWPLTAKTSVDARAAYLERNHSNAPERDFSGPVGNASVTWDATEKIRLVAGVVRDLGSYQAAGSSYVQRSRIFVAPVYKPTVNTALNLRYERDLQSWRGAAPGTADSGRRDVTQWLSATFDWEPRRKVTLSGSVRAERRTSNLAVVSYRSTTIGAAVKVRF